MRSKLRSLLLCCVSVILTMVPGRATGLAKLEAGIISSERLVHGVSDELSVKSETDDVAVEPQLNDTDEGNSNSVESFLCLGRSRESFFSDFSLLFSTTQSPLGAGDMDTKDELDKIMAVVSQTQIKGIFVTEDGGNFTTGESNFLNYSSLPSESEVRYCNRSWDEVMCWPEIPEGYSVTVQCFASFKSIAYDTSRTVTRACNEGGIWEKKTNYSNCQPLVVPTGDNDNWMLEINTIIYFIGYSVTLMALLLAVILLLSMKELHCLRNVIHTNLMLTYIFDDALWLISSLQSRLMAPNQGSCITFILLHYFHLTNFFWMLVEGLYLYFVVVKTFTARNIKLRMYIFIGWGLPLLVVLVWAFAKWMTPITETNEAELLELEPEYAASPVCKWLNVSMYDWIYKAPAIIVLGTNMLFLLQIMWVLITKLRSATNPETQQKRKAAKAFVVLMPLLGITYILVLAGQRKVPMYEFIRAVLISMQGFLVALLYCFLNGEVRQALRHRWNRVRGRNRWLRYLCCCRCHRQAHTHASRNWSMQRSRTESIRLYNNYPGSTTSFCNQGEGFLRPKLESPTSGGGTVATFRQNSYQFGPEAETPVTDQEALTPLTDNGIASAIAKAENGKKHMESLDPHLLMSNKRANGSTNGRPSDKCSMNGCDELYG